MTVDVSDKLHVSARRPLPLADRVSAWRDVMSGSGTVEFADEASFEGAFSTRPLGELRTMRIAASTYRLTRDRAHAARTPRDYVLVNLVEAGGFRGRLAGRMLQAGPGDLVLSRHTDRMDVWLDDATWLALLVPCDLVERHMRWPARLNGSVHPAGSVAAAVVGGLVSGLCALPDALPPAEVARATAASLATLAASLALSAPPPDRERPDKDALARSIRRFIADRLADPALDPELIGRTFDLSRSVLYRTMGETGDVATIIRRLRLYAIRREIVGDGADQPLAALARRWGMTDERTFRRAFAREFGCSPSALRDGTADAALPGPVGADLHRWFLGL